MLIQGTTLMPLHEVFKTKTKSAECPIKEYITCLLLGYAKVSSKASYVSSYSSFSSFKCQCNVLNLSFTCNYTFNTIKQCFYC